VPEKTTVKTFVIVNPASAGGATMKRWPRISDKLERAIGRFDYDFTNAEGVATLLANQAAREGYQKIIAVGGDGTIHEALQGIFDGGRLIDPGIIFGTLPCGSGTDFARTLGMSNDIDEAVVRMRGLKAREIDVGLVKFKDHQGNPSERYFINMADVGLGGEIAERANNTPKRFGGFATYLFSSVMSLASYKPRGVKMVLDGEEVRQDVTSVFVANGQFCGGGMWIAPAAQADDGFFNVIVVREFSKWDLLALAPKLYSGRLLSVPGVKQHLSVRITVESDEDVLINLDGEQVGTTPAAFTLIPNAVRFKV
jgi:YegS/Rv2252/BmrU family lipid kinase